jgi:nucleotide-binding universal stress UspA family protein
MRVLVATDGSTQARRASVLAASIPWPTGSVIETLAVADRHAANSHLPIDRSVESAQPPPDQVVADAAELLADREAVVATAVIAGRPASVIVSEATRFRADLVIVGSRGLGPVPSMLLGSVSAEVVDHAPCPVLVARAEQIDSLIVGVDGSATSAMAVDYLAGFRFLQARATTVVSVVQPVVVGNPARDLGFGVYDVPAERLAELAAQARQDHARFAAAAVEQLRDAEFAATPEVFEGQPAHVLIDVAASHSNPLLVLGTHGRTGVRRAVLGSVARNVLLHARSSVLVVRGPVRARSFEPIGADTRRWERVLAGAATA